MARLYNPESLGQFVDRNTIRFVRRLNHSIERVWRAITDVDEVKEWFMTPKKIELRGDGEFEFGGALVGTISRYEPPRLIEFTGREGGWRYELSEREGGCELVFVTWLPEGFSTGVRRPDTDGWDQPAGPGTHWPGMLRGWHGWLEVLEDYLEMDAAGTWAGQQARAAQWADATPEEGAKWIARAVNEYRKHIGDTHPVFTQGLPREPAAQAASNEDAYQAKAGVPLDTGTKMLRDAVASASDEQIDAWAESLGGYGRIVDLVFAGFTTRLQPGDKCIVRFDVGSTYTVKVDSGSASYRKRELKRVDAIVKMTPQDFLRIMGRSLDGEQAARDGRMVIEGDPQAVWKLFGMVSA
jgi:uncharacterized protein YndB with AHSA1/START domain